MKVYFISGLGADKRVFKNIMLPEGFEAMYIDWIAPFKNESLSDYALRMAAKIDSTQSFVLLGLSMGGMVVSEIHRKFKPAATILVSSVPVYSHLPPYFRLAGKLPIQRLIPARLVKSASIIKRLFAIGREEDKKMLMQMIDDTDITFIRWAVEAIATWKNEEFPLPYTHIHGSRDNILPVHFTKPTHVIARGTHLIVMDRADEINAILKKVLVEL